jgi:mannosyltransferase OCH1-like enzyme
MRSDLFRYAVLLRHGGVYLDANLTAALPLHLTVLATPGFHATAGKNSVGRPLERMSIRNDFIASPPEHPIVLAALMTSVRNVLDRSAPNLISLAGPPVLSEAFRAVVRGGERGAGTLHVWETLRAQCLRGSLPRPAGQDESHWTRLSFEAGFVEG